MTVASVLNDAIPLLTDAGIDTSRLDAELLLAHVLHTSRGWLWAHREECVSPAAYAEFTRLLDARQSRTPLPYLLGVWEFYGRDFTVTPAVLTPRPETELLVEAVVAWARIHDARRLADIGTGSGAIAVTLALELPSAEIVAVDISPEAVQVASANVVRHGVVERITVFIGDLLHPLAIADVPPIDALVANLPYICDDELAQLMPEVRDHEPRLALAGGPNGLCVIHRLIDAAPALLRPGGLLALEVGWQHGETEAAHLRVLGWDNVQIITDYSGIPRHLLAERSESSGAG